MDLKLDIPSQGNRIQALKPGLITINGHGYRDSLVVMPETIIYPWSPKQTQDLKPEHLQDILQHSIEIVLLGTGQHLEFPEPSVLSPLIDNQIGFEIMDTPAACRTYTVLLSEGRQVAAALML